MTSALRGLLAATVLVAVTPSAMAADSSLGVSLGYVKPNSIDSTLVFSGDFRFHLNGVFALSPEFSYWKESQSAVAVSTSIQDLQFGVNLLAVLPVGRRVEFFVGGGGGLHHATGNLALADSVGLSDSTTRGGVDLQGGIDIGAGDNLSFFLATRYDWVLGIEGEDSDRLDQYKFVGGFRVRF